jgi:hypothetical protein
MSWCLAPVAPVVMHNTVHVRVASGHQWPGGSGESQSQSQSQWPVAASGSGSGAERRAGSGVCCVRVRRAFQAHGSYTPLGTRKRQGVRAWCLWARARARVCFEGGRGGR